MAENHRILIIEDDAENARTMSTIVLSMGFDCRVVTTLDQVQAALEDYEPCAVLQDIQIPYEAGERPHEMAGQTSIGLVRAWSNGKTRVPIIVVTAHREDPDFVWAMGELECDEFVMKKRMETLAGKLAAVARRWS